MPGYHVSEHRALGHCGLGHGYYGINVLDEECQGINLLDAV